MAIVLPFDIFRTIYDHVSAKADAARSCLVSKKLLSIARPLLYSSIKIAFNESLPYIIYPPDPNHLGPQFSYSVGATSTLLISTLRNKHNLAALVRCLKLERSVSGPYHGATSRSSSTGPASVLVEILALVSSVETVVLDNLSRCPQVDSEVLRFQTRHGAERSPIFRFIARGSMNNLKVSKLKGVYEGFKLIPFSRLNGNLDAHVLLGGSSDTLRRISIPLDGNTSLSAFPSLERLSLYLPSEDPSHVVSNLTRVLPPLAKLRLLSLRASSHQHNLTSILSDPRLAASVPPLLTHVSFDFGAPTTSLEMFIEHLPRASSLRVVNFLRERLGGKELEEVEEVDREQNEQDMVSRFAERGIQVYYDEEWNVW